MFDRLRGALGFFVGVWGIVGCGTSSSPTVTSPDGGSDAPSRDDAGAIDASGSDDAATGVANGTVGEWQTLAPMPVKRANFCATNAAGYVVAIGGNYKSGGGFVKVDDVHVAKTHADGSLDPWKSAGKAPSALTECTVAAAGSVLYLLDAIYDDPSKEARVWSTTLSAAGDIGPWSPVAPLPANVRLISDYAWIAGDVLLALHANLSGSTAALHAPISAQLSPWSDSVWLGEFRGRPQWASAAGYAYVLGGYSDADAGNVVLTDARGAKVNADGTMGPSFAVAALPKPTTFGAAAAADDYVFVFGGRDAIFGGTPRADVLSGHVGADGAIAAWTPQPLLPDGRTNFAVVVAGNYAYALGGAASEAVDTVFASRVRYPRGP